MKIYSSDGAGTCSRCDRDILRGEVFFRGTGQYYHLMRHINCDDSYFSAVFKKRISRVNFNVVGGLCYLTLLVDGEYRSYACPSRGEVSIDLKLYMVRQIMENKK